jgi:ATP/maltotriose-dependent transcriptional regulator MalT
MVQAKAPRIRQPKIIERPRLTRQLDECGARIMLLIAPAGYGKTTLARQWLSAKPYAWCALSPASRDVAALAQGIADGARTIVRDAGTRMGTRLRLSTDPSAEVGVLVEMLGTDLAAWPEDAWLALDDYHAIVGAAECEEFVQGLIRDSPIRLLLTCRSRPSWATSRARAYGDHYELDEQTLAMTEEEAAQVIADPKARELSNGWPAVVGLAASLIEVDPLVRLEDSAALHAFLAEELLKNAPPKVQRSLSRLSLCPDLTFEQARRVLGAGRVASLIDRSSRLGLVSVRDGVVGMHPLVRQFIRDWHRARDPGWRSDAEYVAGRLVDESLWDAAHSLIDELNDHELLDDLLRAGLAAMLEAGRHTTVEGWVTPSSSSQMHRSPWALLAEAEVASRRGDQHTALALSVQAARASEESDLAVWAWNLAGRSAHLLDHYADSNGFYRNAERLATTDRQRFDALWGQIVASRQFIPEHATKLLPRLTKYADSSIDAQLRLVSSTFEAGLYRGSIRDLEGRFREGRILAERASNPLVASSFLVIASRWFATTGRYEEALRVVDETVSLAEQHRLSFVLPSVLNVRGMALAGIRKWGEAARALSAADAHAQEFDDVHNQVDSHILKMRLDLARGKVDDALAATLMTWPRDPGPLEMLEFYATCELVRAAAGAETKAGDEVGRYRAADITTLEIATRAVRLVAASGTAQPVLDELLNHAVRSGCVDGLVVAYRACPVLLTEAAQLEEFREFTRLMLDRAHDVRLAKLVGLDVTSRKKTELTRREREVHELLAQGLTNKEIAKLLYVEEVTVKVHVRHILDKLGVRSRVEAATRVSGSRTTPS